MTEFAFPAGSKSSAGTKVILTSGSNFNSAKFLSAEELSSLKSAARNQQFEGKVSSFVEVYNGKTRIIAAGTGIKPTALELQILGGKLYKKINKAKLVIREISIRLTKR